MNERSGHHAAAFDQRAFEASLTDSVPDMPEAELAAGPGQSSSHSAAKPVRPAVKREELGAEQPAWAGKMLGRFRLMRLLGEGMMGRVIQAEDMHLHRLVALKVLRTQIHGMDEAERVNHFLREARAAAQLDHPGVVRIFEINEHQGWWYIAMEMLEGQTLREFVQHNGPLPPVKACVIIADAADALAAAHAAGIIHRDIKPNNLMISRTGRCKLTDFGLVHYEDPSDPFGPLNRTVGTPQYMSPEAVRRMSPTPASDIYSLGATLYFALTGRPPFDAEDVREALRQHLSAPPPDARVYSPQVSERLAKLVMRCLAKDAAQRPTAMELASALRLEVIGSDASFGLGGSATISGSQIFEPREPARSPWAIPMAAAVLGALIALGLFMLWWTAMPGGGPAAGTLKAQTTPEKLFPAAPTTYGVRPAGEWPIAATDDPPPAFSWKLLRPDLAQQFKFVASKRGRLYFPVDDPRAALIRADEVVGYSSAAAAEADKKVPAP